MERILSCRPLSYAVSALAAGLFANLSQAANATWYSTNTVVGSASWTNSYNWSAQPYPAGDQTATFNNSGNGRTTIDVAGLTLGCKDIFFDTANAAAYTIGSGGANGQALVFTNNSIVRVASSVNSNQTIDAITLLGQDRTASSHNLRNDKTLANVLVLAGNVAAPSTGGTGGTKTLITLGTGSFLISGNIMTNGFSPLVITNGTFGQLTLTGSNRVNTVMHANGSVYLSGTNRIDTYNLNTDRPLILGGTNIFTTLNANGTTLFPATVTVTNGGTLAIANGGGNGIVCSQDTVINGQGTIFLSSAGGENYADNGVANGKTCVISAKLTGPYGFEYYHTAYFGTFVLSNPLNDFLQNVIINGGPGTISVSVINNRGVPGNLGAGTTFIFGSGAGGRLLYTGAGEATDRYIDVRTNGIIEVAGTGNLKFTSPLVNTVGGTGVRILSLRGSTSGSGEFAGALRNLPAPLIVNKSGSGTWTLSTNNTYTGSTTVGEGTLALSDVYGAILSSSAIVISNSATLLLSNTAAANNSNRLGNAIPLVFNGGTLRLANTAGSANYLEEVGPVTLAAGNATIATAQAAAGQTATLRLAALAHAPGGAVDFTGAGLGGSDRNRIFITGQPDGLIGPWATVNGNTLAAYSATLGVYAAGPVSSTDIAARGPSTIVSNDSANVRINTDGVSGPITLGSDVTRVASVLQNTATPATIDTASKTLQTGGLVIPSGRAAVTVGQAAGDGTLSALQANGELTLNNDSANGLTVNAVVADNGAASKLNKAGSGTATLTAANTFSGDTGVGGGTLVLANADALQNSTLTTAGTVFDSSVAGHAFELGGLHGAFNLALADNAAAPNAVALTVGQNNKHGILSGTVYGNGSLSKAGDGVLTLSGANTFNGGLSIQQGTLVASNANALGAGAVANSGTLNLHAGAAAYSGLSTALTGSGTNNVVLSTGANTTTLNGDYSGFTGLWNVGVGAAPAAGKVQMNGRDNASAAIVLRTNATLFAAAANQHNAALTLQGGDTGESYGQLRLEGNANWAGPITLAGPITGTATNADAYFGSTSGSGFINGSINDQGAGYTVDKTGGGTVMFAGANAYRGPTWVKQGTLRVPSLGSVNGGSSPLGAPTSAAEGTVKLGQLGSGATLYYVGTGDQSSDRIIDLSGGGGANSAIVHAGTNTLTLTGDIVSTGVGAKTLTLSGLNLSSGTAFGTGVVAGVIYDNYLTNKISLTKDGSNVVWRLANNNLFSGNVTINAGALLVAHSGALGVSNKLVIMTAGTAGHCQLHLDGSAAPVVIETNVNYQVSNTADPGSIYNIAGTNTIKGNIDNTAGGGGVTFLSQAGKLTFSGLYTPSQTGRALYLRGDGDGEIDGVIRNGATPFLPLNRDQGSGTWTISNTNAFDGLTTVSSGTLVLGGAKGALLGNIAVSQNATFTLANSEALNNANRLGDSSTSTLSGGTFRFSHSGGAAHYTETTGPLVIGSFSNVVQTSQADEGYTSVVSFASLSHAGGGLLDFRGTGLGEADARNQVLISAQPAGLIGLWATHNTTNYAAYDLALGVIPAGDTVFTDIPAQGEYEIANDAALNARIGSDGTAGPLALNGVPVSALKSLMQNWNIASTIGMTNQTLQVADVMIAAGQADLTLGTEANEGVVMPPAAGGGLTLINQSASLLTLNAAVTNNTTASSVAKYGPGAVKLLGHSSYSGTTLIDEGVLEFGGPSLSRLPGAIGGSGTLTKSGTNVLHLLGANTYTGPTYINEGVLRPDKDTTFGPATGGGVTIANGATLDLGCDASVGGTRGANTLIFGTKQFTVSGAGVNGAGAIVNNSGQQQMWAINRLALAADTTIGGNQRWDLRYGAPVFDMYDHTLSKTGVNEFCIINATVNPGAGHLIQNQGTLRLETGTVMNGSPANTITVNNGAMLDLWNFLPLSGGAPTWSLTLNPFANFRDGSGNGTNYNVWAGTITLNGTNYFNGGGNPSSKTLLGSIGGTGTLVKNGGNNTTAYLFSSNNTYSGGTIITNGILYAKYPGSLPGYDAGKVLVAAGMTLALPSGDGTTGWNGTQLQSLHDTCVFATNTAVLSLDTTLESVNFTGNLTQPLTLTKQGNNTLTLAGANSFNGPINVNGGDLVMNGGPNHRLGNVTIGSASVLVTSDSTSHTYATNTVVGNGAAEFGRMTLAGSAVWGTVLPIQNTPSPQLSVGNSGRGVFVLQDNAVLTNKFIVGVNGGSHGAFYQRGNSYFHNWGGQGNDSRVGQNGYGYYELSGGTMTNNGFFQLGVGTTGIGILSQYGGAFRQATKYGGQFGVCRGGIGVVYLAGGTFESFVSMNVGEASENTLTGGTAIFTVDGTSDALVAGTVNVGDRTNMFAAVNLNGGTLTANLIAKGSRPTATTLLGFDGGTYRARAAGNLFGANANTLDKVLVYAGGATLDSSNLAVTANANLLAPSGNGVASITLTPRGGYIGPPMVTITGGGGAGATALANFDSASGFVTGVTITSPGYDYLTAPTVTLSGGGTNLQTAVTGVTLAPNVSGGLTKRGTSTLTLSGTNTFGGTLTLAEGTLKLAHAQAVPAGATLTFSGGTLDLNGLTLSNLVSTTAPLSGSVTNGTLRTLISPAGEYCTGTQSYGLTARASGSLQAIYLADVAADGACDVLAVQGDIDLSSYALQIVDLDWLSRDRQYTILTCTGTCSGAFASTNLPDPRWKLYRQADNSLKLLFSDGFLLRIR